MFGDRVAHARERLGLTQARLAELSGVSRQMVSAVEANRHLPRVDAGQAMAAACWDSRSRTDAGCASAGWAISWSPGPSA
jgi:transcriptional regulator with XRE-family HTH domain